MPVPIHAMNVRIYIYRCVYTYIYTHRYCNTSEWPGFEIFTNGRLCHVQMPACEPNKLRNHVVHTCTDVIYIYTYIHTCIYIYRHVCVCVDVCGFTFPWLLSSDLVDAIGLALCII